MGMGRSRALTATMMVALLALTGIPGSVRAAVPDATVKGPIGATGIHGYPLWDSWFRLADIGYEEAEYFISGTARNLDTGATAPYTTRIIVTRPSSADRFSGTVLLDWVNVTAQFENAVDTITAHEFLLREGWAFVHVSAQAA